MSNDTLGEGLDGDSNVRVDHFPDIRAPNGILEAILEEIHFHLDVVCLRSENGGRQPAPCAQVNDLRLVAAVDAMVRSFIVERPVHVARTVRIDDDDIQHRLIDIAPSIFCPGYLIAIEQRLPMLPILAQTCTNIMTITQSESQVDQVRGLQRTVMSATRQLGLEVDITPGENLLDQVLYNSFWLTAARDLKKPEKIRNLARRLARAAVLRYVDARGRRDDDEILSFDLLETHHVHDHETQHMPRDPGPVTLLDRDEESDHGFEDPQDVGGSDEDGEDALEAWSMFRQYNLPTASPQNFSEDILETSHGQELFEAKYLFLDPIVQIEECSDNFTGGGIISKTERHGGDKPGASLEPVPPSAAVEREDTREDGSTLFSNEKSIGYEQSLSSNDIWSFGPCAVSDHLTGWDVDEELSTQSSGDRGHLSVGNTYRSHGMRENDDHEQDLLEFQDERSDLGLGEWSREEDRLLALPRKPHPERVEDRDRKNYFDPVLEECRPVVGSSLSGEDEPLEHSMLL